MEMDLKYFGINLRQEWTDLIFYKRYRWIEFHFVEISTEWDKTDNTFNIFLGLLGFNLNFWIILPWETEEKKELIKRLKNNKLYKERK